MIEFNGRIAVFGGRDITESIYNDTVEIGRQMAKENWLVFCGGGEGVMAVSYTHLTLPTILLV